jgi:hypothetical protein
MKADMKNLLQMESEKQVLREKKLQEHLCTGEASANSH